MRILASDLKPAQSGRTCILAWASFEERCLAAAEALSRHGPIVGYIVHFSEEDYDITRNLQALRSRFKGNISREITFDRENQIEMLESFKAICREMSEFESIFIDISCFPRDSALIFLLVLLGDRSLSDRASIVYNLASDYGFDEPSPEKKWLSRGVVQIAPVLGYRGRVVPGREICVLGLLGLDDQRFLQIVDNLQPDHLLVGVGTSNDRDRNWLTAKNDLIATDLQSAIRTEGKFYFDCDSLRDSFLACEAEYSKWEHMNVCIVPLNNKISTLAAGLLAFRNRNIQICHGSALLYNMKYYSKPGDSFLSISISEIYEIADS